MGATGYGEKQAKDIRKVRLTFIWGTESYPATKIFGVKGA